MKNMMMALAAAIMMSASAMAQDNDQQVRRERKPMDKTEMIKKRTDETVKTYGLNEEQAAKLLELNTRYADKMRPMPRGGQGRFGRHGNNFQKKDMKDAPKPVVEKEIQKPEKAEEAPKPEFKKKALKPEMDAKEMNPEMAKEAPKPLSSEEAKAMREEMQKVMEAYEEEMKAIMTPEQYEQYQADSKKRFQEGRMGRGRGHMQHRNNNNK